MVGSKKNPCILEETLLKYWDDNILLKYFLIKILRRGHIR